MKRILYTWVSPYCRPPRWMALAYYSCERHEALFAAFPLNLLIAVAWWVQDRWARAAHAPSWIEREVEERIRVRTKLGRFP